MALYKTGTLAVDTAGEATGTDTSWTAAATGIRSGQTVLINTNPAQQLTIQAINNATSLTLSPAPASAIPAGTTYAILVTDALSVDGLGSQVAEAITYFKNTLNGRAASGVNSDITLLNGLTTPLSVAQGGTGSKNPFGTAAGTFVEGTDARLVNNVAFNTNNQDTLLGLMGSGSMVKAFRNNGNIAAPWDIPDSSPSLFIRTGDTFAAISFSYASPKLKVFTGYANFGWAQTYEIWHTRNTTVDGNGFIKKASPIARLSSNPSEMQPDFLNDFALAGVVAVNEEAKGVSGQRISEGVYIIKGALGLAKEGWTIEVPQDVNGNRLIFVETEVSDSGDITVSTFKRRFDPESAMIVAGDPMDIPEGRWVDLRLKMPQKLQVLDPVSVE